MTDRGRGRRIWKRVLAVALGMGALVLWTVGLTGVRGSEPRTAICPDGAGLQSFGHPGGAVLAEQWCQDDAGRKQGPYSRWFEDGQVEQQAVYVDGRVEGVVRTWFATGAPREEGQYAAGKKTGLHSSWHKNGQLEAQDHYVSGRKSGRSLAWWSDATPRLEAEWQDGVRSGGHKTWFASGQPALDERYLAGKLDGPSQAWSESGTLVEDGGYAAGEYDGTWTSRYASGGLKTVIDYTAGKRTGQRASWHDNGQQSGLQERYVDDREEGLWTRWDDQGRVEETGPYVAGKADGTWEYFRRGELIRRQVWASGERVSSERF